MSAGLITGAPTAPLVARPTLIAEAPTAPLLARPSCATDDSAALLLVLLDEEEEGPVGKENLMLLQTNFASEVNQ